VGRGETIGTGGATIIRERMKEMRRSSTADILRLSGRWGKI